MLQADEPNDRPASQTTAIGAAIEPVEPFVLFGDSRNRNSEWPPSTQGLRLDVLDDVRARLAQQVLVDDERQPSFSGGHTSKAQLSAPTSEMRRSVSQCAASQPSPGSSAP